MVSVSTKVPDMKATPSSTARAVANRRSLRAARPLMVVLSIGLYSPNCFMRSSTRSAVGSVISSTMRPSLRNTTRLA